MKILILLCLVFLFLIGCDVFNTEFEQGEGIKYYQSKVIKDVAAKDTLTVMEWNIKFAGGRIDFFFDCYGNRETMTTSEVLQNLANLVKKINEVNPDVIFMEEADVDSKRCSYIDNVRYILDHTDLNYGYYASQWKADFVPSDGIGRVNSGNAVLSKYPLKNGQRIALPLINEQDALTKYFYLRRNLLICDLDLKGNIVKLIGTHTSAFAHDGTKAKQINILKYKLISYDLDSQKFICAGDLNTIPPNSIKWSEYPDSKCEDEKYQADDYSMEKDLLTEFYKRFSPAISLDSIAVDQAKYFSHTTNKNGFWNRKLDYIFTTKSMVVPNTGIVYQDEKTGIPTMPLSDHAPTSVKVRVK